MSLSFHVVRHERGFSPTPLPIWTDNGDVSDLFEADAIPEVVRQEVEGVPGAFQLLNVLTPAEADHFVAALEEMGFEEDAPVSLPRSVRHNHNVNWVVSEAVDQVIWQRSAPLVTEQIQGEGAKGINARFRTYRYEAGDFFKPHTDGAWPGSRVINGEIVQDAYPGLMSQYTFLIFLSDGYSGGRTEFLVSRRDPTQPARSQDDIQKVSVSTPKGGVLCFPHGSHPQHCVHAGEPIRDGAKYIIRSDILF
ncbi:MULTISPECIES: oxidoreductase [unclassified Cobetia]|uniref:oxidoreductase n=1 Tax=unclassified Cobetia TaxID=2609414 RepID=UPI0020971679|nr:MULTISPECIES: oxidoreductase [unclassified Cobetia]MCO7231600.1 oxidoreductase [Cobetia sp. Dlab-2-AX]MCO7235085.1 oxidoreductase [Cobetia sp. Dlab-2-U]